MGEICFLKRIQEGVTCSADGIRFLNSVDGRRLVMGTDLQVALLLRTLMYTNSAKLQGCVFTESGLQL